MHDEIKPERGRNPYLGHGVLFVPDDWLSPLVTALGDVRKKHQYFGEVHFRDIKGASRQNKVLTVAAAWVETYFTSFVKGCPFKACFAEDGRNRSFPYPGDAAFPEHLLKSLLWTYKGGVAWSFHREHLLRLRIVNDNTDSELDLSMGVQLPHALQTAVNARRLGGSARYPWLRVLPVEFVDSNPKRVDAEKWAECELVQLCDLLLGPASRH